LNEQYFSSQASVSLIPFSLIYIYIYIYIYIKLYIISSDFCRDNIIWILNIELIRQRISIHLVTYTHTCSTSALWESVDGCSSTLSARTSFPFCIIDRGRIYALLRYKIFLRFGTRCRFQDITHCLSIERDIKMMRECEIEREDSDTLNAFELAFL
jgi:hypothetical protein